MREYSMKTDQHILGKINFNDQIAISESMHRSSLGQDNKKVLILHTGGTIGMFKDENGKYGPEKQRFKQFLLKYPYFRDEVATYFGAEDTGSDEFSITPETMFKKRIWYKFMELSPLIDSTNMSIARLNYLLSLIKANYDKYDAFIILHGTDTMSYTASALSFMIENLKKTIIITGSQVPIAETRNDGVNNLLCALTIAGHYIIPQVLLVFDNTIMRGNRTTKTSASSFASFFSPNFYPIGTLGLTINIRWEVISPSRSDIGTEFHKLSEEVSLIKLTPFGYCSEPNTRFVVIESYGIGNIPTQGKFYEWVKKNSQKPKEEQNIIVNISQVYQSVILNLYATGYQAEKLGMIPGSDMTCEAAVAKLSFLASRGLSDKEIEVCMKKNLRGELTETEDRTTNEKQKYVVNTLNMLNKGFEKQSTAFKEIFHQVVNPTLTAENPTQLARQRMKQFGLDWTKKQSNGMTLLHQLCRSHLLVKEELYVEYIKWILKESIHPFCKKKEDVDKGSSEKIGEADSHENEILNALDADGCSAIWYALQSGKYQIAQFLKDQGGQLIVCPRKIFHQVRSNNLKLLSDLNEFGDKFVYQNSQQRNCLMYSLLLNSQEMVDFFADYTDLCSQECMRKKDMYGKDSYFYLDKSTVSWGERKISEESSKNST